MVDQEVGARGVLVRSPEKLAAQCDGLRRSRVRATGLCHESSSRCALRAILPPSPPPLAPRPVQPAFHESRVTFRRRCVMRTVVLGRDPAAATGDE